MDKRSIFFRYWSVVLLYTAGIFFISSFSYSLLEPIGEGPVIDKIFHVLIYSGLGFITSRAFFSTGVAGKYFLLSLFYCLCIGMLDEMYQKIVPHRYADGFDVVADFAGAVIGGWAWRVFSRG